MQFCFVLLKFLLISRYLTGIGCRLDLENYFFVFVFVFVLFVLQVGKNESGILVLSQLMVSVSYRKGVANCPICMWIGV